MQLKLFPVSDFNAPFLLSVYSSTRSDEMSLVPWSVEQKAAFLEMQFQAQHQHYLEHYPNASYQIITLEDIPAGRLYVMRSNENIRIMDITLLPEHRGKGIGKQLINGILEEAQKAGKKVEIYIENFKPSANLFSQLGFQPVAEEGFHILWQWNSAEKSENIKKTAAANS